MIIKRGFTLIELLMVIAIMGIMATFTFGAFRGQEKQRLVQQSAITVVDALKQAQTLALTRTDATGSIEAYVVSFNCFILPCIVKVTPEVDIYDSAPDPALAPITTASLGDGIFPQPVTNEFLIAFSAPRGNIVILNNDRTAWSETEAVVKIRNEDDSIQRCVTINRISGRIDIGNCP